MALSLGRRSRRRSPCREAGIGGKGRAGCRHFHVHYHCFPRQVCPLFSSLRLPPYSFSLLSFLPVLFLAVLAFLVCFGWFTLVYFVSFLLRKCNGPHDQCIASDRDDNEAYRNEKQDRNKEETGGSAMAQVCIEGQQIKEVFVDEFSNASLDMSSRMASASPHDCSRDEERSSCEKLVEEVMVFDINCKDLNEISSLVDVSSEKEQIQDTRVNWFDEEIGGRELCTSCGTSNLVHLQADQESVANIKEASAYADAEILELIDKQETGAVVEIYSDDSAENDVECRTDLPDDFLAKKLPEDFVDEQQDTRNTVTDRTTKRLRDDQFIEEKGKQRFGNLDGTHDFNNETEMPGLPLDSVSENKYSTVVDSPNASHLTNSDEVDGHEKELAEDNWAHSSDDSTSLDCDFGENDQGVIEDISVPSTEDNIIHEMASGEGSVIDRVEDEDENSTGTSEGGPHTLPLIRRSQPPWWNLCGVLDVFAGCQD